MLRSELDISIYFVTLFVSMLKIKILPFLLTKFLQIMKNFKNIFFMTNMIDITDFKS